MAPAERTEAADQHSSDESADEALEQTSFQDLVRGGLQGAAVRRLRKGLVDVNEITDDKTQWTHLHWAAYYGAERVAAELVKQGANVHAVNTINEYPLHLAAKWPHEKVVEVLLKAGANPNALNKRGRTPAHTASQFARRGALELIINAGGDVSLPDADGNTPLHLASLGIGTGPNEVVRMLLRAKCRLDLPNKQGVMPLDKVANLQSLVVFSAMESLPDLMTALIKKGGVKLDVFDGSGMTPLQTAAFKGDMPIARALLAGGAKVNFQATPAWAPCASIGTSAGNVKPLGDRSPLHFAAERGNIAMMELLIAAGAKVNNTSNEGLISPLHMAVWNGQPEAVRVLLAHKADVKARVNKNGMAPLHFACNARAAKLEIISSLLDAKADIEERCSDGLTPLMLAAQMAPADAVRLLLVRGARVQAKGRRGMTAVDCAEGRADILNVLAQHCAARRLGEMAAKATAAAQRASRHLAKTPALTLTSEAAAPGGMLVSGAAGPSAVPRALTAGPSSSQGAMIQAGLPPTGNPGDEALIDQLKQQLSCTSAQLYAWAAATAKGGAPGGGGASSNTKLPALPAPDSAALTASSAATSSSSDIQATDLQQLLGGMASLSDLSASGVPVSGQPASSSTSTPSGSAATSAASMNTLSEAVQMLSCITAIVTNQAQGRPGPGKIKASAVSGNLTASASVTVEEISSVTHMPIAPATFTPITMCTSGKCALSKVGDLNTSLAGCACKGSCSDGSLQPTEHQLQIKCTANCAFAFHLPCWKVARDKLRQQNPSFPASFTQIQEPVPCFGAGCDKGLINWVQMVGPAGTQVVYVLLEGQFTAVVPVPAATTATTTTLAPPPTMPAATFKTEVVFRPTLKPAPTSLPNMFNNQFSFVAEKPASPPPAPAPVVASSQLLLPPADAPPLTDSPPSVNTDVSLSNGAADNHMMRRKRRPGRESKPPGGPSDLLHASGEVLQGRNPPPTDPGMVASADPLARVRVGLNSSNWEQADSNGGVHLSAGASTTTWQQPTTDAMGASARDALLPSSASSSLSAAALSSGATTVHTEGTPLTTQQT